MSSIRRGKPTRDFPMGRWEVRYRDPAGFQRTKTFDRKDDAERWDATNRTAMLRGDWLDPNAGRVTFAEVADAWLQTRRRLKPRTLADYEGILRARLLPQLQNTPVAKILPATVEALLADLQANGAKPGTVRNTFFTLQSIMRLAVRNRLVGNNPCQGVELPRSRHQEMLFLTADEVARLARYTAEPYPVLIYTAAYCGLRAGELGALRVKHLDLLRRRIHVRESLAYVSAKTSCSAPPRPTRRAWCPSHRSWRRC
jgi:integrase